MREPIPHALVARARQWRYGVLLALLALSMGLHPFVDSGNWVRWPLILATLGVLASALFATWSRRHVAFFVGVAVVVVIQFSFRTFGELEAAVLLPFATGLQGALLALIMVLIFADVMRSERVTMNAVFGACCVYVLMGLTWAAAYSLLEYLAPGSFTMEPELSRLAKEGRFVYYSLVTLTTVGYGDIAPVSPQARMLAALEGLVAQLFLAIIIARLIGMELAGRMQGRPR